MAVRQTQTLFRCSYAAGRLYFSTSCQLENKWRIKQGLEPNPNKYGPLNILSDFSYVDGRPVPLSAKKQRNVEYQKQLCQRIVELSHELDVGLQQYHENLEKKKKAKAAIIQNKLKPKGAALLKKNSGD